MMYLPSAFFSRCASWHGLHVPPTFANAAVAFASSPAFAALANSTAAALPSWDNFTASSALR